MINAEKYKNTSVEEYFSSSEEFELKNTIIQQ